MSCDLAVQIVNFRTREHLGPCLESVRAALAATDVTARVLVLDNGSGDDLSLLEERFAGAVEFLHGRDNVGFGAGHNRLAAIADSTLLCCLNPDMTLDRPDVFSGLLAALDDPRVGVAGPRLVTLDRKTQRWDHGELRGMRARVANGAGHAHWRERSQTTPAAWVSGAFLLVRREAFDAVGGFDEAFFLYKEEEDLCLRIRHTGRTVLYVPEAQATHVGAVVAGRDPAQLAGSTARYAAKHFGSKRRWLLEQLYMRVTRRI